MRKPIPTPKVVNGVSSSARPTRQALRLSAGGLAAGVESRARDVSGRAFSPSPEGRCAGAGTAPQGSDAWAVSQGYTVFVISWVNPDESLADTTFGDYMQQGILTAIDAIGLKALATFKVGARPRSTAFLPDSSRA